MFSGLFYVEFKVADHSFGTGLVVIDNGRVNGGDQAYLYRGHFDHYSGGIRATVEVSLYRGSPNSVLGPLRQFTLNLSGTASDNKFELEGGSSSVPGVAIRMVGTKVAELFQ